MSNIIEFPKSEREVTIEALREEVRSMSDIELDNIAFLITLMVRTTKLEGNFKKAVIAVNEELKRRVNDD